MTITPHGGLGYERVLPAGCPRAFDGYRPSGYAPSIPIGPRNRASERVREDIAKYGDITFLRTQVRGTLADYFFREDRRSIVGLPDADADGWIEQLFTFHDLGLGSPTFQMEEVVAVRGERLALYRIDVSYADGQESSLLAIAQYDAQVDLVERFITFGPDDVDAALDELNRLSANLDAGSR